MILSEKDIKVVKALGVKECRNALGRYWEVPTKRSQDGRPIIAYSVDLSLLSCVADEFSEFEIQCAKEVIEALERGEL